MADEFDSATALRRNKEIIYKVQKFRDMINREIIDYYIDREPGSAEEYEEYRQGIRKYLRYVVQDIDALLDDELRY